jgi:hypothetical protein
VGDLKLGNGSANASPGPKTLASIAEELGAKVDSIEKAIKRKDRIFTACRAPTDSSCRATRREGGMKPTADVTAY